MDLVGSDHAELSATNGDGQKVIQFKLDYISDSRSVPSGYATLGVTGGEGRMILGKASAIVKYSTSLDRNLNERGYAQYTTNSPATDDHYTPSSDAPNWDYRVVYEAWIDHAVFGPAGFGDASIEFVHASPSKADTDTLKVKKGECPCVPGPDHPCDTTEFPSDAGKPECIPGPDNSCKTGGDLPEGPKPGDPGICAQSPDDPKCIPF
jgi:hypothetical protein